MDISSSLTVNTCRPCYSGVYCGICFNPGTASASDAFIVSTAGPIYDPHAKYYVKQRGLLCYSNVIVVGLVKIFKSKYGSTLAMYMHIVLKVYVSSIYVKTD